MTVMIIIIIIWQALEEGRNLSQYRPREFPILVSLGRFDGLLIFKNWTMTGIIPAAMKEFVEQREMSKFWLPAFMRTQKKTHAHLV